MSDDTTRHEDDTVTEPGTAVDGSLGRSRAHRASPARQRPRARGLIAAATTVAVVVLLVALLMDVVPRSFGPRTARQSPTTIRSAATTSHGKWDPMPSLSGGGVPVFAPTDSRVAYRVTGRDACIMCTGPQRLERTDDSGAHWQELALPGGQGAADPSSGMATHLSVVVSPLAANSVFLAVGVPYPQSCPTWPSRAHAFAGGHLFSGYVQCSYTYRSSDGGQHWQQIALPVGGMLAPPRLEGPVDWTRPVRAQGATLYALNTADIYVDLASSHLVRSSDGGATWQAVDAPILAQHEEVVDVEMTPTGNALFAVSSRLGQQPFTIWRSDDAGASWHDVGALPATIAGGPVITEGSGNGLLMYTCTYTPNLTHPDQHGVTFYVSANGGRTWDTAPDTSLPRAGVQAAILGVLSDGSIVARSPAPSPSGPTVATYYAWKLGQSAWRQITPPVTADMLIVTPPGPYSPEILWAITQNPVTVQRLAL